MSSQRMPVLAVLSISLCVLAGACGPSLYTAELLQAQEQFEVARAENASFYAPYEFHFAQTHLEKAREEASEASYEEAIRFAKTAADFSERALEITRRRRNDDR